MTCKEKLALEHPDKLSFNTLSGCIGCPDQYGYLDKPADNCSLLYGCERCWDREIPETLQWPKENPHISDSAKTAIKLLGENARRAAENIVTAATSIKDSGDRTEFETGAVRDMREGKGRCDLMPLEVVAEYFRRGIFEPDPKRAEDFYWIIRNISDFKNSNYAKTDYLYQALSIFMGRYYDYTPTAFLEVAKHFEEGAKKYGENNWQKGIPPKCYIDSAVRHFLKVARCDDDEPHDRAFVWNLMCCIWEVDYREKEESDVEE